MARTPKGPLLLGAAGFILLFSAGKAQAALKRRKITMKDVQLAKDIVNRWLPVFPRVQAGWVLAIIGNESRFNVQASNLTGGDLARGGAWGLMQMTLKTALGVADKLKAEKNPAVLPVLAKWNRTGPGLLDPNLNIMMGMAYLNQLAKGLGDAARSDPYMVVAAYNRGLGAIRAMLEKREPVENLAYVQHVIAMKKQLTEGGVIA